MNACCQCIAASKGFWTCAVLQGYMPGQLYNLNSKYGTKEELVQLLKGLNGAGILPVADIVINHRCVCVPDQKLRYTNQHSPCADMTACTAVLVC